MSATIANRAGPSCSESPAALLARARLTVVIPLVSIVLIALVWIFLSMTIHQDRAFEETAHQRASSNLARAFEEHTVRTINLIDQTLILLKREYEIGQAPDLEAFYRDNKALSSVFLQIALIGPDGMLVDSNIRPLKAIDLSDREHFRVHLARDTEKVFIGKPVKGRVTNKWSIQATRRINRGDGSFGGVLVGAVDPSYFANFYREVDLGENGVVSLVGRDGIVRARRSGDSTEVGQDLRRSQLFQAIESAPTGSYEAASSVDHVHRVFTYRTVQDHPLVVSLGTESALIYADHRKRLRSYSMMGGVATFLIIAIGGLLFVLARNLQREREIAEAANRMKSEFLAHVSHELRTPLHGILGFADFLKGRVTDEVDRESAQMIQDSGQHLLAIVNLILDLAKIEAGKLELAIAEEEIVPMLETVAANYRIVAGTKGLDFRLEIEPSVGGNVRLDRTRVVSMINNLLDNAVKFTDEGAVALTVRREDRDLVLSVTDSGPGIAPEAQAAIFEKFRQADAFVTRRHGGTGLGLALVRELAALMRGSVSLQSTVGTGSTFTIRIPVEAVGPAPSNETSKEPSA